MPQSPIVKVLREDLYNLGLILERHKLRLDVLEGHLGHLAQLSERARDEGWLTYTHLMHTVEDLAGEAGQILGEIRGYSSSTPGGVRTCRGCGCTDNFACEGGCSWVDVDLCSACADAAARRRSPRRGRGDHVRIPARERKTQEAPR